MPAISIRKILENQEWIKATVNYAFTGLRLSGPFLDEYVAAISEHFKIPGAYRDAVKSSLGFATDKVLTEELGELLAVVLAGGIDTLKEGTPVLADGVVEPHWAPIEVRDCNARIVGERAFYELELFTLGGPCSGLLLKRALPWGFLYKFKRAMGIPRRSTTTYRDLVLMRLLIRLCPEPEEEEENSKQDAEEDMDMKFLPTSSTKEAYVRRYRVTPQCVTHNKKLLAARKGECLKQKGVYHNCCRCVFGYDECELGTHPTRMIKIKCTNCEKENVYAVAGESGLLCRRCFMDKFYFVRYRKKESE